MAPLLLGYQEFDRLRVVGRVPGGRWRQRRAFRRILRAQLRGDALDRSRRLTYRYPLPRPRQIIAPPHVVAQALARVDPDARPLVEARLRGQRNVPDPGASMITEAQREARGLMQLRDALINEALAHPPTIVHLHPQFVQFAASPPPRRRHRPLLTFLLVKLPLGLVGGLLALLVTLYVGAWAVFNDEVLGDFVSDKVSGLVEGELRMRKIHWGLPLIYDLVTGQPTYVEVEDVTVWEPYESYGGERLRPAAHADKLRARLVLHEIIPWNRLGIPTALEIPWVLHFTDVQTDDPAWFTVRQYRQLDDEGVEHELIGLRDAFVPVEPPDPNRRGLSFAVDNARFSRTELDLDFEDGAAWRTQLRLDWVNFRLAFEAPAPDNGLALDLPLQFAVEAQGPRGGLKIDDLEFPLEDVAIRRFDSGFRDAPAGDVTFEGEAVAAGSTVDVAGALVDALARAPVPGAEPLSISANGNYGADMSVRVDAATEDAGGLTEHLLVELDLPPSTVYAHDRPVRATIEGPTTDPRYALSADRITLDLLEEPAWALDDVDVQVAIENARVPAQWDTGGEDAPLRKVVTFDRFDGAGFSGAFRLHDDSFPHIVMPEDEDEPWRIAMDVELEGIDPSLLMLDDPDAAEVLAGTADGRIDLRKLEIGPPTLPEVDGADTVLRYAEFEVFDGHLTRDRGPSADGLPKDIEAHGVVRIDEAGGIDLSALHLSVDGGSVEIDGGVEADFTRLRETLIRLRIDRGAAFFRAFGQQRYLDTLRADLTFFGSPMSPSSKTGVVRVTGVGDGPPTEATVRFDKGTVHVHTDRAHLFGGVGPVDGQVVLFGRDELLDDPKLAATAQLRGIKLEDLVGQGLSGVADVEVSADDGHGKPTTFAALVVHGKAFVPRLSYAGTIYRDAEIEFSLGPNTLQIERLILPIHRRVSPLHGPDVTVQIGEVAITGEVGLRGDPSLDLVVDARGVPTRLVGGLLGVEVPVRGQIAEGTHLTVGGTLKRPRVEGQVELVGLSAEGIALGSGRLEVTSEDAPADGPFAAHRELRARGELSTPEGDADRLQWTVDAVVAIGDGKGKAPIDAEVDVQFGELALRTLLARSEPEGRITGQLEGLGAHVVTCNEGSPMLSTCLGPAASRPELAIDLVLDHLWLSGDGLPPDTAQPCSHATTLCSEGPLQARLEWPVVSISGAWPLSMGQARSDRLEVSGAFDLGDDTPEEGRRPGRTNTDCSPPAIRSSSRPLGGTGPQTEIRGVVDLATLAPLLAGSGIEVQRGELELDIVVGGNVGAPRVGGRITLPEETTPSGPRTVPVVATVPGVPVPIELRDLDLRIVRDWLTAAGTIHVAGKDLQFGSVRGENTGFALSGECAGHYGVAAEGSVSAQLLNALAGSKLAPRGSVDVAQALVRGSTDDGLLRAEASTRFQSESLYLDLTEGLADFRITDGRLDLARCQADACPGIPDGAFAVYLGGKDNKTPNRPEEAVAVRVGAKGRGWAWGTAYLAEDFTRFEGSDVYVDLRDVPYRDYDVRGRPVYDMEVTATGLRLRGGDPLVISGDVDLDRARYVKDAIEGVNLLAFTESVDVLEAPPPEIMRTIQFDLHAETDSFARIDNNVAQRVEAQVIVDLTGTYEHPEFTGRVDIEPGGSVDIPFVTGTYEIQRGRISLVGEIDDAEVDILALRNEPVYIEGTPRKISLLLGGTVSAITWDCIVQGDTSKATSTQRGCLNYLVLGEGDVAVSDLDVQRSGGGGLTNARKPLQVVGHVTEFDFGKRIESAAPRYRTYIPDVHLRLGQIGPELEVATPREWLDFDYGHAVFGWHYTRGYPGFLLRQSRELNFRLEILDPVSIEYSRDIRAYLNERIIFDPLQQRSLELRLDFEIPSLR